MYKAEDRVLWCKYEDSKYLTAQNLISDSLRPNLQAAIIIFLSEKPKNTFLLSKDIGQSVNVIFLKSAQVIQSFNAPIIARC